MRDLAAEKNLFIPLYIDALSTILEQNNISVGVVLDVIIKNTFFIMQEHGILKEESRLVFNTMCDELYKENNRFNKSGE